MNKNDPEIDILTSNKELGDSLKRFFRYNAGIYTVEIKSEINNKIKLAILDLHTREVVKKFGEYLKNAKHRIPFTIIIGIEKKLEDYDKLFLGGPDDLLAPIRLLTHACGKRYCQYFSLPYEVLKLSTFLSDKIEKKPNKLPNPFKKLSKVKVLQGEIYSPKVDFFEEAGRYAVPGYRKRERLEGFHEKKNIDHLLAMQFYDLALAYVKHKSQIGGAGKEDKKNTFNVLLIENKPERVIEELGPSLIKELKELVEKPEDGISTLIKKLKELVGKLGDNIGNGRSLKCCLKKIEELFDDYKFWIYPKDADYQSLKDKLNSMLDDPENKQKVETEIFNKVKPIYDATNEVNQKKCGLTFRNIDLILIDIFLDEGATLSGLDFLRLFTLLYPEIPSFIMSGSEDTEVIGESIKGKADYYILKKNIFSLPFIFYKYLDDLGALVQYIKDPDLKRSLIGNLRYWRYKKDFLWFGDKCYHMVNHSYDHVKNDWNIANQIVPHLLDALKNKDQSLSDEEIYAFCMAIWLHDIGHKGNEHYGEPHEIRDLHGLISAELVMKHPESYGCYGYLDGKASPYRWANFGAPKTAPQLIMERMATLEAAGRMVEEKHRTEGKDTEKGDNNRHYFYDHIQKLTILEQICLLCIYHKSNFPLDDDDFKKIRENGKRIPLDCYYNKNKNTTPIHLKSIANTINDANSLNLAALFRFIDGMDINQNRVGDNTEEGIKKRTIERDLKYQILKLKDEVNRICHIYLESTGKEKRFFTLFYERAIANINEKRRISDELKKEQERFLDTLATELNLENYYMLSEYIEFLCVQNGHFGLHNSIYFVEINMLPPHDTDNRKLSFEIKYKTHKDKKYLNNREKVEVKERGEKEGKTIRDHLLGEPEEKEGKKTGLRKNDGYVRRELNNGKNYLKEWFDLDNTQILICDMKGKTLFKEDPLKEESNE